MADYNENNTQELLNAIGDMSFLPKEVKDENLGRDFPKLSKYEKYYRLGLTITTACAVIAYLVCLFIYGPQGKYFNVTDGSAYGWIGLIVTAIFAVFFALNIAESQRYDTITSLDEKKKKNEKPLQAVNLYISLLLLYGMFMTTILRNFVFQKAFSSYGWFLSSLGLITYILIAIIAIIGVILNFKKPNVGKIYNYIVLILIPWVVICYSALLQKSYSMSSNYGILMLVFGAISVDVATLFLIFQKKHAGLRSTFYTLLTIGFVLDLLAIILYGLI